MSRKSQHSETLRHQQRQQHFASSRSPSTSDASVSLPAASFEIPMSDLSGAEHFHHRAPTKANNNNNNNNDNDNGNNKQHKQRHESGDASLDLHQQQPAANRPKASTKSTKRIRTMLTNDWLADMVNNNVDNATGAGGNAGEGNRAMPAAIELKNVYIRETSGAMLGNYYFRSLNLSIPLGGIFAIVGSARSGKTLLLKTLAGIRQPARGKIRWLGPDRKQTLSVGFMAQRDGYFGELSPTENLEYLARVYCVKSIVVHNKLHQLMQLIGWQKRHVPLEQLSAVEQSLTALALATLHSPAILLLDEPNYGADLFLKEHIWKQLKKLTTTEYVTIVFTTSVVEDVRFANQAAFVRSKTMVPINLSSNSTKNGAGKATIKLDDNESRNETVDVQSIGGESIQSMLTLDVDKIRQFVRQSYLHYDAGKHSEESSKTNAKAGSINKAYENSDEAGDGQASASGAVPTTPSSEVQLEMSWMSSVSAKQHYDKVQLKRIRREKSTLTKFFLVLLLLLKLAFKEPFFLISQLILPGVMIAVFNYFVGQNPHHIPVGIYNPDTPAIISKHVLSKLDNYTIEPIYFDTLDAALDAAKQHLIWAVVEFPQNYTNSMINRAIQNCENSVDEFEDEPEAETIYGHLSNDNKRKADRIRMANDDVEVKKKKKKMLPITSRNDSRPNKEIEEEEDTEADESDEDNDGHGGSNEDDEEEISNKDLINDVDVNHKKSRPVNIITVRLYVDNTNLLISGFIKGKIFQALQLAERDPDVQSFSPKIPQPLKIMTPNIYGEDEAPMAEFLIAGLMVIIVFLCSTLLPLKCLHRLETHTIYETMRIGGVGHFTLLITWWAMQVCILAVQVAIIVFTLTTATSIQILGSIPFIYVLLFVQGLLAITYTCLVLLTLGGKCIFRTVMIQILHFLTLTTVGGLLWPVESVPRWMSRWITQHIPQALCAETLRSVISRGWSYEQYWNTRNDIIWRGLNVPLAWLLLLVLILGARIKLSKLN